MSTGTSGSVLLAANSPDLSGYVNSSVLRNLDSGNANNRQSDAGQFGFSGGGGAGGTLPLVPSPTDLEKDKTAQTSQLIQTGKQLFQAGKLKEADATMDEVLKRDPSNKVAHYYKNLAEQNREVPVVGDRKQPSETRMVAAEKSPRDQAALGKGLATGSSDVRTDVSLPKPVVPPPTPQPEILTRENAFSTFSLNVSDVSFKLAAASLEKGQMPESGSIRSEEFINAFDYRDPEAAAGAPIAFASERARYPFAQNREMLRFSLKTAAAGRQAGRPLNIVLLLDNSGSMERADRVRIIQEALRVLTGQLQARDTFSIVTFARTAQLRVDGVPGNQAAAAAEEIAKLTPEGGTNLGAALDAAYEAALHHYLPNGDNRVVMLTDGAANLGDVDSGVLKQKVEAHRKQGVALDCFGIGWEGYNDDLLETLTRNGDGRYGFINTLEEASTGFAAKIAGALHVAAADVKVQVEFNPRRVTSYRQIGYAKHQLTKEQFRDNTVDAAEIAAQEAGNALYTIEINPQGEGSIATVHVRYKIPGTTEYREQAWDVPYTGSAVSLEKASPAMRLATTAGAFSEWLAASPFAEEVTTDQLLKYLSGVPQIYGADTRPAKLEWMIRQARSISGK
jgi:Mg-chelatase subunit ChlD